MNNDRLKLLRRFWEREWGRLMAVLSKSKSKQSKSLKDMINSISDRMRDSLLTAYLNKCKMKHALTFFEWRKEYEDKQKGGADYVNVIA